MVLEDDNRLQLSLIAEYQYAEDVMRSLPNVDTKKHVIFKSYNFTDKEGKKVRGIRVEQDGVKIPNYYFDSVAKKDKNGIPPYPARKVDPKTKQPIPLSKAQNTNYRLQVNEFLVEETEKRFSSLAVAQKRNDADFAQLTQSDVPNLEDIPF